MLKIGDFSRLSMISVRMLRYFDEKGLLKPERVDEITGYRYYEEHQLVDACNIKYLQNIGFGTKDIKKILKEDDKENLSKLLDTQKDVILKEYNKSLDQLKLLEYSLLKIKKESDIMEYNIIEKTFPSLKVISLRDTIASYEEEGSLWREISEYMIKNSVELDNPCYSRAIFHDAEYKEEDVDVEVQLAVVGDYSNQNRVLVKETEEKLICSITFTGGYEKLDIINQMVANYILSNNYKLDGPMFNIYHVSPAQEKDPNKWVTESCFPIKK